MISVLDKFQMPRNISTGAANNNSKHYVSIHCVVGRVLSIFTYQFI